MSANDDEPITITCEVMALKHDPESYLVEVVDHASEGEVYRAIFSWQDALPRALAYAAWAYGHNGIACAKHSAQSVRPPKLLDTITPSPTR